MEKFGKSQSVLRKEDVRFITGAGQYVDDIAPEGAKFAFFLRSQVAHGVITTLDVSVARDADGVHLVVTAQDIVDAGGDLNMSFSRVTNRDGSKGVNVQRPVLATQKVRFVGEPVAMIVADSLAQAKDAAELIELEIDELPAHTALASGGTPLFDEVPDNIAFDFALGDAAAVDAAFARAARVVEVEVGDNRIIANAMEPRGCFAEWDGARLHFCVNGQGVWGSKKDLARQLGLERAQVRVTNPDVGGGFGMKAMEYPEHVPVAFAAKTLGLPVRWIGERTESMLTDNAGRDLVSTATLAFDADNRIIGYKVRSISNLGAYSSSYAQFIQTELFSKVLTGVYNVQPALLEVIGVFTNTTQVDAYRGAGRPEAIYLLERMMDYAAHELGVDSWELRRKNFIPADAFPYKTAVDEIYDVGDFHRVLDRVEDLCDRAGFPARKAAAAAEGKLLGLGLCYYIESILGDQQESVKVTFNEDGTASIYVGTQSNGQGHETVFAQFLSDQTGIPAEKIFVIQGDSDLIKTGGGTGGSRSVTVQTNVTLTAVAKIVEAYSAFLAEELGSDPDQVSFDDETFRIAGSNQTPSMLDVAEMAREKGRDDLLTFEDKQKIPARSFPNGAHVAEIEIDPATGVTRVLRYTVTDDFGNLINPMLAEGQVHGGVVQGIGQALTERVVYDENGQLLTATFMDYGMPRADDVPMIVFSTEPVPSTANVMGMKGCGEAGTVGALAAVSNGVLDALRETGVERIDMPFTPERVWTYLNAQAIAAE